MLLHVVDVSHPGFEEQMKTTRRVLEEMGLNQKPILTVFNKVDRLGSSIDREHAEHLAPEAVFLSASTGEALEDLRRRLEESVAEETVLGRGVLSPSAGSVIARIHALADVMGSRMEDGKLVIRYRAHRKDAAFLERLIRESGGS